MIGDDGVDQFMPGPWHVEWAGVQVGDEDGDTAHGSYFLVVNDNGPVYSHERAATAQLIQHAPEMLAMLERVQSAMAPMPYPWASEDSELNLAIDELLAKVRGVEDAAE